MENKNKQSKTDQKNTMLIILLLISIFALVYLLKNPVETFNTQTINTASENNLSFENNSSNTTNNSLINLDTKTTTYYEKTKTSNSSVIVDLTPKHFESGKLSINFGINTHTFNSLDKINLKKAVILEFNGKSINPLTPPKLSGHHNNGTLIFETVKEPVSFKITIKGIPDIKNRVFEW